MSPEQSFTLAQQGQAHSSNIGGVRSCDPRKEYSAAQYDKIFFGRKLASYTSGIGLRFFFFVPSNTVCGTIGTLFRWYS